jgi:hypothetical protein
MLLHPWLLYYRRRLIVAALVSVFVVCFAYMWISGDGLLDFGIFWHSVCRCPVDSFDTYILLNLPPLLTLSVGLIFGFVAPGGVGIAAAGPSGVPFSQHKALSRFFLTRPISRANAFFLPQVVAITAIAIVPMLAFLLITGWLRLVHAPSLHELMATIRVIPAVDNLGRQATLAQVLGALSAPRRYLAALSVGICAYAILSSQQWLLISPDKKLNALGVVPIFVLFAPMLRIIGRHATDMVFLAPGRGTPLTYMPSALAVALHFGIAAAIFFGCWCILRRVEL